MVKLVFWALVLLGLALSGFGVYFVALGSAARGWPVVEGEILSTSVRTESVGTGSGVSESAREQRRQYYPRITYRWSVDGISYTGSRFALGTTHEKYGERQQAREAASRFSAGSSIPVYYQPSDPSQAVLDRGMSWAVLVPLLLGLLFLATGGLGLKASL